MPTRTRLTRFLGAKLYGFRLLSNKFVTMFPQSLISAFKWGPKANSNREWEAFLIMFRRPLICMLTLLTFLAFSAPVLGEEHVNQNDDMTLVLDHNKVTVSRDVGVIEIPSTIINFSDQPLTLVVSAVPVPEGWIVELRHSSNDYQISEVSLLSRAHSEFLLRLYPPESVAYGEYEFPVVVTSVTNSDSRISDVLNVTVAPIGTLKDPEGKGVELDVTYPSQIGPAHKMFEFDLEVKNLTGLETTYNLIAQASDNWEVAFVPSFDQSKVISSISLVKTGRQVVKIQVTPPLQAIPGKYPVLVVAFNEEYATQMLLEIDIIGQGELRATLAEDRLDIEAIAGKSVTAEMEIANISSVDIKDLVLLASAPTGWEINFGDRTVDLLEAGETIDVAAEIIPPTSAIPGDYYIALSAVNPDAYITLNVRVIVKQSTIWRWFGLGMVLVVVGGLLGLYIKLSRR